MANLKMYILIKDSLPFDQAILTASHAPLSCYLTFEQNEVMQKWAKESFRNVVCKVTEKEFEKAKTYGVNMLDYRIMTETILNFAETSIVFKPMYDDETMPKFFKFLKLYK